MTEDQEQQLLIRWQHGDLRARDELVHQSHKGLLRAIQKILKAWNTPCTIEASDICQETQRRAIAIVTAGEYQPGGARWLTYCFRIAKNVAREEIRRQRKFRPTEPQPSAQPGSPLDQLLQREQSDMLIQAISQLPRGHDHPLYEVFCRRCGIQICDGQIVGLPPELTNEQIGALYNRSRAWASKQYTKALQLLCDRIMGGNNS